MVFSSNLFLFFFLPLVLFFHTLLPFRVKNVFLFLASLCFYTWGSGPAVFLLIISITVNYFTGRAIGRYERAAKPLFLLTVVFNLALLFYFKYFVFFYNEFAKLVTVLGLQLPPHEAVPLPIGISFFTFQAISYLGEIYRKEQKPAENIINYGMYIALFPHLIAGPIVRYSDISAEITSRRLTLDGLYEGLWRFSLGLGKKVIIANRLGAVVDQIFNLPPAELSSAHAWIGTLCYTFQIYFDFSGYSDMAIGLARMLGFHFPENFNQPYRAQSVTEFWHRWHMTLSRWFRDFVYIPLGGNRAGPIKTYFNLWLVFFLCGLWHGAAWNFVVWGLFHGVLLVTERVLRLRFNIVPSGWSGNALMLLLVMISWVLFRANSFEQALTFLKAMFGFSQAAPAFVFYSATYFLDNDVLTMLVLGALFSWLPIEKLKVPAGNSLPYTLARSAAALVILVFCAAILSTSAFNPFIYFRF